MSNSNTVEIQLFKRPDESMYFKVRLRSMMKPGVISEKDVEADAPGLQRQIMATGGALAEYQHDNYGDQHDPDSVAKTAGMAFNNLLKRLEDRPK